MVLPAWETWQHAHVAAQTNPQSTLSSCVVLHTTMSTHITHCPPRPRDHPYPLPTMSDQYSKDTFASQEAESMVVYVDAHQEQDAPATKKKKMHEEVIDVVKEEAEERRNTLSEAWEEEEMVMPSPQKRPGRRPVDGQGANPRRPLTARPTPKQLARRFTTTSKRKTEKKTKGEDSSSSAEKSEALTQVMSNRSRGINLTVEEERDVAEWFQDHDIFYNKKLTSYKDTGKKARLLEEKAAKLNVHGECNLIFMKFGSYTDL